MLNLSSAAITEKNKLASDGVWLVLLEIRLPSTEVIRVVRNNQDIVWPASGGNTYAAFPFEIDTLSDLKPGEVPSLAIKVSNVTRALTPYLESGQGGVGAEVYLRVVHSEHLDITDPEIELVFKCVGCSADSMWATFELGASNPYSRRFPGNRILKNFCRYKRFKGPRCGYSGGATTCDRSLKRCRELGNSTRYGGFPVVGAAGIQL
jgi:lambda family phage minor tail protein L